VVGRGGEAAAVLDRTPHHLRLPRGQALQIAAAVRRGSIHLNHPNAHQAEIAGEVLRMRMIMHPRLLVPVARGEGVYPHHQKEVIRKETGHLLVQIHLRHVKSHQGAVETRMMAEIGSVVVGQGLIAEVCPPAVNKQVM